MVDLFCHAQLNLRSAFTASYAHPDRLRESHVRQILDIVVPARAADVV